jgi:purine-binding chemotaxis protein CheW
MNKETEQEKLKLPPQGLANEILEQIKRPLEKQGDEDEIPKGSEQIYSFADQLKRGGGEGEREKEEEQIETWVTFSLGDECFGLPVSGVKEILRVDSITHVPHAPHAVRGVTNMRGKVLPVVDLRVRLGLSEANIGQLSRILVVESRGRLIGFLVDAVQQVIRLNKKAIQPPPPDIMTNESDYIIGVYHLQDVLAILLDVNKVLLIKDSLQEEVYAGR